MGSLLLFSSNSAATSNNIYLTLWWYCRTNITFPCLSMGILYTTSLEAVLPSGNVMVSSFTDKNFPWYCVIHFITHIFSLLSIFYFTINNIFQNTIMLFLLTKQILSYIKLLLFFKRTKWVLFLLFSSNSAATSNNIYPTA